MFSTNITNKIKLVIWDMDETFWKGTLSEGGIEFIPKNISMIKELTDRGIMNSISSKNDFKPVKKKLEEAGIFDLFVFPHINWNDKGVQIKEIIDDCKLRPVNVLFIDDNIHNLQSAKHYCPDLNVITPDLIDSVFKSESLKGNEDKEHKRLKQFKILEQKKSASSSCKNNEDFLFKSNIKVEICSDCETNFDRIFDLINRSNQLNYTKIRLSKEELLELLNNKEQKNYYVKVKDNFGDYGIVGFVSLNKNGNKALHLLFSCRTIGMGVEQWVWAKLNYPEYKLSGEVINTLKENYMPKWINQTQKIQPEKHDKKKNISILLKGGCDLSQLEVYLKAKNITTEFNYLDFHRDHTCFALDCFYNYNELSEIRENVPFLYEKSFETEIFSNKYDVIVMSVLMDYCQALYEYNNNTQIKISYGAFHQPITKDNVKPFTEESLHWFMQNFTCKTGGINPDEFKSNLEFIRKHIGDNTKLIIINGCEINHENQKEKDFYKRHIIMNNALDEFIQNSKNTYLLDMRKIVTTRADLTDNIRHYKREIYYLMACELTKIINSFSDIKLKTRKKIKINFLGIKITMKI